MTRPISTGKPGLICLGRRATPAYRLICVPYAGAGAAAYFAFREGLAPDIEAWAVRLPGRETRVAEPALTDIRSVVELLTDEIAGDQSLSAGSVPFALFGHSMGALIAFELARSLRRRGLPVPVRLFVSGRRAPAMPDDQPSLHRLPSAAFLAAIERLGGLPTEILADVEMVDLILPALRADFAVCETYEHRVEPPLPCGISAFGGRSDPTTTPGQLAGWQAESGGRFTSRLYDGDHFFLHVHTGPILRAIREDLAGSER